MRIALCYYGLSSNIGKVENSNAYNLPVNYLSTYNSHINSLITPNKADVFIHTWDHGGAEHIVDDFSPKSIIIEPQIDFILEANKISNDSSVFGYHQRHHILSRWYSNKKVLELKKEFEEKNNFEYDLVMVTRFDCKYEGKWNLSELNPNNFYCTGGWGANYNNELPDLWFISNSKNMDIFSKMYDNLYDTFHENRFDNLSNQWGGHLLVRRYLGLSGLLDKLTHYKNHHTDSDIVRG